jgi:hypothetical protein
MDLALCEGIIRQLPDGTRQRLKRVAGKEIVLEELPCPYLTYGFCMASSSTLFSFPASSSS